MKKTVSLLLCLVFLLSFPVSAAAAEAGYNGVRTSRYCGSLSMSDCRDLFADVVPFGIGSALTRGMAASVLARYDGADTDAVNSVYSDVQPDSRYAFAAAWNAHSGVLPLEEDGLFHADEPMNREALAVTLKNYIDYAGRGLDTINSHYAFMDTGLMNEVGQQAAFLMQELGILIEEPDGYFLPFRQVSIGEAESIFLRFFGAMHSNKFPTMPISTVPASAPVPLEWFEDACFIGHSQVVGLADYSDLHTPDYYCCIGFDAQNTIDYKYFVGPNKRYGSLDKIFHNFPDQYKKVYIMLGINDCSDEDDRLDLFNNPMRRILDIVKETQPNATIYLLSLLPVGHETPNNILYNLDNVMFYTQAVKSLSREYGTEFLDVFRLMAADDGYFRQEFVTDGIHIPAKQNAVLVNFLQCHTLP